MNNQNITGLWHYIEHVVDGIQWKKHGGIRKQNNSIEIRMYLPREDTGEVDGDCVYATL